MDCSTPGLPVHQQLPESTQTHVHWVSDAIQPPRPLSSPSPPAFNLSQHQGLFKWVSSSHQMAKVLEFQFSISPSSEYSGLISLWEILPWDPLSELILPIYINLLEGFKITLFPSLDLLFEWALQLLCYFWFFHYTMIFIFYFLMWTTFKVFIEFAIILFLCCVLVFWLWSTWELSSPTRGGIRMPSVGRWSLNPWTTREVLWTMIFRCSLSPNALKFPFSSTLPFILKRQSHSLPLSTSFSPITHVL